jgi:hypothetical protein
LVSSSPLERRPSADRPTKRAVSRQVGEGFTAFLVKDKKVDYRDITVTRDPKTFEIQRVDIRPNGHPGLSFNRNGILLVLSYEVSLDLFQGEHTIKFRGNDFNPLLKTARWDYRLLEIAKLIHDGGAVILH